MKFDVVIGNPPYQGTYKKAAKLWPRFYEKGLALLKPDGFLTFVSPATWLNRSSSGAWRFLKNWDVTSLVSDASVWFPGVASSFCIPTIHKRPYSGRTRVDDSWELDLQNDTFPANNLLLTADNVAFLKEMSAKHLRLDVKVGSQIQIDDPRLSISPTETHLYETYYSSAKARKTVWCSEPHGDLGKLKLIVGLYGNIMTSPEITTKAAGAKSRYILGEKEELERVLLLMRHPHNKKWVQLMSTNAFSAPLTYIADV